MYRALSKSRRIGSWWPGRRSEDSAWLTSRAGTEVGWCRIAGRTITGGWREIGGNLAEGEGHESGWIRASFYFHSWNRALGEQSEEGVVEERAFLEDETGWKGAKKGGVRSMTIDDGFLLHFSTSHKCFAVGISSTHQRLVWCYDFGNPFHSIPKMSFKLLLPVCKWYFGWNYKWSWFMCFGSIFRLCNSINQFQACLPI